jgi:hypothetical protein
MISLFIISIPQTFSKAPEKKISMVHLKILFGLLQGRRPARTSHGPDMVFLGRHPAQKKAKINRTSACEFAASRLATSVFVDVDVKFKFALRPAPHDARGEEKSSLL